MLEMKKILMIGLTLLALLSYINNVSATVYRTYVDQDYGFYRIIVLTDNVTTITNISYVNKTLNISVGDTIIWRNDATPDEELNIISDQKLWNNTARLRWNYQNFNYTFDEPGTYTFHVKEYPRLQQQKIIVNSKTPTLTPIITDTPIIIQTINKTEPNKTSITTTEIPAKKTKGFEIMMTIMIILLIYKFGKIKYN